MQVQRLVVILGTAVVMTALWLFIKKTALGAALEATAQHREGAQLCGIKVSRISAMAFVVGTALAGIAGVLIGPAVLLMPTMGMGPLLVAFSAIIFGGLGSIPGAVLGGASPGSYREPGIRVHKCDVQPDLCLRHHDRDAALSP